MLTMFLCINFSTDFSVRHPPAQPSLAQPSPAQRTMRLVRKSVSVYSLELDNGEMLSHNLAKVFLI